MIPRSLILLALFLNGIEAAPAPVVETLYQTHINVIRDDGSIFTFIEGLFDNFQATPTTAAVAVAATVATPATAVAAATTSASSFDLDSLLSNNLSKWLGYFGIGSSSDDNTAATTAAAVATSAAEETDTSFPAFTFPNKSGASASAGAATTLAFTTSSAAVVPTSTYTPTTATTSATSQSSETGVSGSDTSFASAILKAHNQYRAIHQAGALTWNDDAYQYAQNNADNYDCSGVLTHTHGQFGENLAAGFADGPSAVKAWYDEGSTYDYSAANTYNHFTQVVWKGSTSMGCAYKDCTAENWGLYVVCEYDPPGNFIGEEAANVLPATS